MPIDVRILGRGEAALLERVADGVFDGPIEPRWLAEFLADERAELAVALDGEGVVVGFASGLRTVHPDKGPELWVHEVGVAPALHRLGIGRRLLDALFARGRAIGCATAWVATERSNAAARGLYAAAGGIEDPEAVVVFDFRLGPGEG